MCLPLSVVILTTYTSTSLVSHWGSIQCAPSVAASPPHPGPSVVMRRMASLPTLPSYIDQHHEICANQTVQRLLDDLITYDSHLLTQITREYRSLRIAAILNRVRHVARPHKSVRRSLQTSNDTISHTIQTKPTFDTNSYISYRQSYAHHPPSRNRYAVGGSTPSHAPYSDSYAPEDSRGLLPGGAFEDDGDAVIEMDLLPPRWADTSAEINDLLADIATKGHQLDKLHQKHVLPGFNDDDAKRAEEKHIERLTQEITRGFHECHRCIQRIEQMVRESQRSGTISSAEETMARNIQISLATRVQEASANFRKKQSAYLKSQVNPYVASDTDYALTLHRITRHGRAVFSRGTRFNATARLVS